MKVVKLQSGLIAHMLDPKEQEIIWKELSQDVSVIGKDIPLYTPQDNLEYFIVSEKEITYDKFEATLKIKGSLYTLRYDLCNQDKKTYAFVRKIYNN